MIHFDLAPEPAHFDETVRRPGRHWLESHPESDRPKPFWNAVKFDLADAFGWLCGYSAMYEPVGTVDHYLSINNRRDRAYEWDNYRYSAGWINSSKQQADQTVLDPFEVEDGWFQILLPSLQLQLSDDIPNEHKDKAEFTLNRLHLRDDERVIRQRREWYRMFQEGELPLERLRKKAPLIARAIENQQGTTNGHR